MPSLARIQLQELFKERVAVARRKIKPVVRERKKTLRSPAVWLFPHGVEREYSVYLRGLMRELSIIALPTIRQNLKRWLAEVEESVGSEFTDSAESEVWSKLCDWTDGLKEWGQHTAEQLSSQHPQRVAYYEKGFADEKGPDYIDFTDAYDDEFQVLMGDLRERQGEIFVEGRGEVEQNIAEFGLDVNAQNAKQWSRISTLAVGEAFDIDSGWVQPALSSWTNLNYTLITSLSEEYIKKVNIIVAEGVQQGATYTQLMEQLKAMDNNMTNHRAELIARDQVGKLNGTLTKGRMLDAGVDGYAWVTALDERVRDSHRQMAGSLNKWDDNSVYRPRGEKKFRKRTASMQGAIPGSQVQCRCTALPSFDDIVQEVDELIEAEEKANPEIALSRSGRLRLSQRGGF